MKSIIPPVVFSLLAVRALSQTQTTAPTTTPTGCPATLDPTCPFFCSPRGGMKGPGGYCSTNFVTGPGTSGCLVCPGNPSVCPTSPTPSCAFICQEVSNLSLPNPKFCHSSDISGPNIVTCSPCATAPAQSTTTQTAAPTATPTGCPATLDPTCPFWCGSKGVGPEPYYCSTEFKTGPGTGGCSVCPGTPAVCPASSTPSCAFICQEVSGAGSKFCHGSDISQPNVVTCSACATSPAPSSTSPVAPPAYTGAASHLSFGAEALIGIAAIAVLNL